ncbi:hydroxymethylbilane synthase [Pollutibacter soli]|uniref:hydroxymethylbilane synthase n=1 Tax=Pollutibacter soli TaxID=3034157 RepID=UPI003013F228
MNKPVRIATRESRLAVWQAHCVQQKLEAAGISTEIVFIKSDGDINLTTPLYELGVQGIFTRSLDLALLNDQADIAVHSFKDVPTQPAKGLHVAAVLKRGNHQDALVIRKENDTEDPASMKVIATSSIRRKAQWLYRYPGTVIENIRGNVNTRLQKLNSSHWNAAIFAAAGLERLELFSDETGPQVLLDWMIPAPAQGAIAVVCRSGDEKMQEFCSILHHEETFVCTQAEREFLRFLQGGCSTPISAFAFIDGGKIHFRGNVTATDGSDRIDISFDADADDRTVSKKAADEMIGQGFKKLISL